MACMVVSMVVGVILVAVSILYSRVDMIVAACMLIYAVCLVKLTGITVGMDRLGNLTGIILIITGIIGYCVASAVSEYHMTKKLVSDRDSALRALIAGMPVDEDSVCRTVSHDSTVGNIDNNDDAGIDLSLMDAEDRAAFNALRDRINAHRNT